MMLVRIKEIGPTPRHLRKSIGKITKAAFEVMGIMWHKRYRAKHFTQAGAREYGYTPRRGEQVTRSRGAGYKRTYTGRKLQKFHHTRPLVYSGQTEALTRIRDVRSTSKGARVVLHANRLNMRNPVTSINMREEMTRVSIRERDALVDRFDVSMGKRINALRARSTRTIR